MRVPGFRYVAMNPRKSKVVAGFMLLASVSMAGRPASGESPPKLDRIQPSEDRTHFVRAGTKERVVMWGVNYDHDDAGRLLEDYWGDEWATVADDFREIKALGANVVRVHLQLGRFMSDAERPDRANLDRLVKLVGLA
jgi:hypothetical protein